MIVAVSTQDLPTLVDLLLKHLPGTSDARSVTQVISTDLLQLRGQRPDAAAMHADMRSLPNGGSMSAVASALSVPPPAPPPGSPPQRAATAAAAACMAAVAVAAASVGALAAGASTAGLPHDVNHDGVQGDQLGFGHAMGVATVAVAAEPAAAACATGGTPPPGGKRTQRDSPDELLALLDSLLPPAVPPSKRAKLSVSTTSYMAAPAADAEAVAMDACTTANQPASAADSPGCRTRQQAAAQPPASSSAKMATAATASHSVPAAAAEAAQPASAARTAELSGSADCRIRSSPAPPAAAAGVNPIPPPSDLFIHSTDDRAALEATLCPFLPTAEFLRLPITSALYPLGTSKWQNEHIKQHVGVVCAAAAALAPDQIECGVDKDRIHAVAKFRAQTKDPLKGLYSTIQKKVGDLLARLCAESKLVKLEKAVNGKPVHCYKLAGNQAVEFDSSSIERVAKEQPVQAAELLLLHLIQELTSLKGVTAVQLRCSLDGLHPMIRSLVPRTPLGISKLLNGITDRYPQQFQYHPPHNRVQGGCKHTVNTLGTWQCMVVPDAAVVAESLEMLCAYVGPYPGRLRKILKEMTAADANAVALLLVGKAGADMAHPVPAQRQHNHHMQGVLEDQQQAAGTGTLHDSTHQLAAADPRCLPGATPLYHAPDSPPRGSGNHVAVASTSGQTGATGSGRLAPGTRALRELEQAADASPIKLQHTALHRELVEFARVCAPTVEEQQLIQQAMASLQAAVVSKFPEANTVLFGSQVLLQQLTSVCVWLHTYLHTAPASQCCMVYVACRILSHEHYLCCYLCAVQLSVCAASMFVATMQWFE